MQNTANEENILIDLSTDTDWLRVSINASHERLVIEGTDDLFDDENLNRMKGILEQFAPDKFILNISKSDLGVRLAKQYQELGRVVLIDSAQKLEGLNNQVKVIKPSPTAILEALKTLAIIDKYEGATEKFQKEQKEWEQETGSVLTVTDESDHF